ncbi:hypothetical protein Tco_1129846, partial [Tanacetum coccineum]
MDLARDHTDKIELLMQLDNSPMANPYNQCFLSSRETHAFSLDEHRVFRCQYMSAFAKTRFHITTSFMASKNGGGMGRKSLYERWIYDYDDNSYDDDDCEDLTEEQLAICVKFNIK